MRTLPPLSGHGEAAECFVAVSEFASEGESGGVGEAALAAGRGRRGRGELQRLLQPCSAVLERLQRDGQSKRSPLDERRMV